MTLPNDDDWDEPDDSSESPREDGSGEDPDGPSQDYWSTVPTNEQIREWEELNPRRRGRAKKFGKDGTSDKRMCQTEVALRLARHLVASPLFTGNVYVWLGGAEVNRDGNDSVFPVARYVRERACLRHQTISVGGITPPGRVYPERNA